MPDKLPYHEDTALLIQEMCDVVERHSFELKKDEAQEKILQTYDLFDLPRPKKVVWCESPFDDNFAGSAFSAGSARSAGSAGSAGSARSARSAFSAGSAWWTALDEDFWHFVFEYEYCKNPDKDYPINENDKKYLEYSQLLFDAIKLGAGYRVEWEDTLYIAPTPLVYIDAQNRFHSDQYPAIRWSNKEIYYLQGEQFEKPLWDKIVTEKATIKDVMNIRNNDKRAIAFQMLKPKRLLKAIDAKLINTGEKGTRLYQVDNFAQKVLGEDWNDTIENKTEYCMVMDCPTSRVFLEWVDPKIGEIKDADLAQATALGVSKQDYLEAIEA